ncbi:MAG TPA: efflux RND transporter periplasmic adaptor subunit [Polyangiaceae bacterium]
MVRRLGPLWLFFLLHSLAACGRDAVATPEPPPPPEVVVLTVQPEDVPIYIDAVGTIDGLVNAEIRARVPGYVRLQAYRDGTFVKKGDLLFTIDPLLTQAGVTRAEGDIAAGKAALAKAVLDIERLEPLAAQGISSKQELDNARAAKQLAEANILSAQGNLDTASANLSYTRIAAPISGLAGLAKVRVGSLVGQGEATLLTTVSQIDSVRVSYTISEQLYLSNPKKYQNTEGAEPTKLDLFLADGSRYPHPGTLSFLDRQVDPSTGTFTVLATFPNPEGLLRPGQYARVRDVREVEKGVISIPQRAVTEFQGTQQVVVVGADDKAEVRPVGMGERVANRWIVQTGLKAGERVVVEGLQKVKNGIVVAPKPAPASSGSPKGN